MKTLIAMMLLTASLVMTAPTASACSVFEDPTGATPTCVHQYEDGYGDETCESFGSHTESTTVTTAVPDVASVYADDSEYCFNGGFGDGSYGSGTFAFVTVNGVGFFTVSQYESQSDFGDSSGTNVGIVAGETGVAAGQSESESDFGSFCEIFVAVGEENYQTIPC